jgi:hypothetical protein
VVGAGGAAEAGEVGAAVSETAAEAAGCAAGTAPRGSQPVAAASAITLVAMAVAIRQRTQMGVELKDLFMVFSVAWVNCSLGPGYFCWTR